MMLCTSTDVNKNETVFVIAFMAFVPPAWEPAVTSLAIFSYFAEEADSSAQKTGSFLELVHFFTPHFAVR